MSDPRTLLNPPSPVLAGGSRDALLNPVPGRLRFAGESAHEEAEDDSLRAIGIRQEAPVHQAA